jgi:hypothetical protein
MALGMESGPSGVHTDRLVEPLLHLSRRLEVLHRSAAAADQVMMVTASELLGELVAGELVAPDDSVHDPHLLEQRKVPVGRALGHPRVAGDELARRQWPPRLREDLQQQAAAGRETLARASKPRIDERLDVVAHASSLPVRSCNESRSRAVPARGHGWPDVVGHEPRTFLDGPSQILSSEHKGVHVDLSPDERTPP